MKWMTFLASFLSVLSMASAASVNGAGSTFAEPIYSKWMSEFQKKNKSHRFNYQGIGSGAGMKQMVAGTVDFAGTDDPMSDAEAAKTKPVLHLPTALGAVVVSYNLEGNPALKLTGETLAKIFNGTIGKWNDPAIAASNPGIQLPDRAIVVVTRSDSSGTTAIFSDYLAKVSPDWVGKNGKTVKWFTSALGGKGNAGVAGLLKQTPGSIGYVELVYALENKLPFALIQNKAKHFVLPSVETVSAAAQGQTKELVKKGFKISLTNSAAKTAYPISAFTWMLIFETMPKEKGQAILDFAKFALSEEAQKMVSAINYAPLPKEVRSEALKALGKIKLE